jgi:hypothetical protein
MQNQARIILSVCVLALASSLARAQNTASDAKAAESKTVADVDAGLGPCTADFTVTDTAGAAVYAAHVRVHITYGFMSLHKFDLDAGTNAEGKARFIGLPESSKQGFFFHASEGEREGSAFDNPSKTCKAQFTVVLRPK